MKRLSWILAALLPVATLLADEVLNNASVIDLKKSGLGDPVIVNKIKVSKCDFDISTDALKKLKEGGLSDEIISIMIDSATSTSAKTKAKLTEMAPVSNEPSTMHELGLWLYVEQGTERRMVKLKGQDGGRSSGWNKKSRATLYGDSATLQIGTTAPSFYYYEKPKEQESGLVSTTAASTVADDFILTKMEVRRDKKERRLAVGKEGFFGGKKSGLDPKDYVATTAEKVADGIYRIAPAQELQPGEYCFINKRNANRESLKYGDVELYDFGVKR